MSLFGNIIGTTMDYESMRELATEEVDKKSSIGSPKSGAVGEHMERVPKTDLRDDYLGNSIVFNSVNKNTQTIVDAGHELRYEGSDKEKALTFFRHFLYVTLGDNGNDETWDEMIEGHFTKAQVYGDVYYEKIFNKGRNKIVDLVSLNPERMDYARNANGNILLNEKGNPIGYTQKLPYTVNVEGKGDTPPEEVRLEGNMIFLKAFRIAHFQLYPIGDGYESFGTIEPAHDDIIYKKNIEKANANSIVQRGMNPIIDYVGTPERFPTTKMIDHAANKLSQMNYKRYFAFPYWHNIKELEFRQSDVVNDSIKMLRENISASLGIPLALATGVGEATNRSTLVTQQKFLELTLNDFVKRTISFFVKQIFRPIAAMNGFKSVPYLVWGDLGAENKDAKAKRLSDYAHKNVGLLPREFALRYIIKSEELEVSEEEIKKYLSKNPPSNPSKEEKDSKDLEKNKKPKK